MQSAHLLRVQDKRSSVGIAVKRSSVWIQLKTYLQVYKAGYLQERILFLNISKDGDWTVSSESEFHSLMVLGKKEYCEYVVGVMRPFSLVLWIKNHYVIKCWYMYLSG